MKTLYLLRHAKSSWEAGGVDDHDRTLNARGIENADQMGAHMRKKGYIPALILCSTARRTRETLEHLQPNSPAQGEAQFERGLYLAPPQAMLGFIQNARNDAKSLLVVAHSPGTEEIALELSSPDGSPEEQARRAQIEVKYPTASLAVLAFEVERWEDILPGTGRLLDFVRPRDL